MIVLIDAIGGQRLSRQMTEQFCTWSAHCNDYKRISSVCGCICDGLPCHSRWDWSWSRRQNLHLLPMIAEEEINRRLINDRLERFSRSQVDDRSVVVQRPAVSETCETSWRQEHERKRLSYLGSLSTVSIEVHFFLNRWCSSPLLPARYRKRRHHALGVTWMLSKSTSLVLERRLLNDHWLVTCESIRRREHEKLSTLDQL